MNRERPSLSDFMVVLVTAYIVLAGGMLMAKWIIAPPVPVSLMVLATIPAVFVVLPAELAGLWLWWLRRKRNRRSGKEGEQ